MSDTKIIKSICVIATLLTFAVIVLCAGAFEFGQIRALTFIVDSIVAFIVALAAMGVYAYMDHIEEGRRERGKRKNV